MFDNARKPTIRTTDSPGRFSTADCKTLLQFATLNAIKLRWIEFRCYGGVSERPHAADEDGPPGMASGCQCTMRPPAINVSLSNTTDLHYNVCHQYCDDVRIWLTAGVNILQHGTHYTRM